MPQALRLSMSICQDFQFSKCIHTLDIHESCMNTKLNLFINRDKLTNEYSTASSSVSVSVSNPFLSILKLHQVSNNTGPKQMETC